MKFIFTTAILWAITFNLYAQIDYSIGQWKDHFPYQKTIDVAYGDNIAYCATEFGIIAYDNNENIISRYSKVNQLSGTGISEIEYNESAKTLVVGYQNGTIDLIKNEVTTTLPFIAINNSILGDKGIYGIYNEGNLAYISTGFGISVLDLTQQEFKESYFIASGGANIKVNSIAIYNDSIFAGTEDGLFKAYANSPFLTDFNNWHQDTTLHDTIKNEELDHLIVFNNKLHFAVAKPNYNDDGFYVKNGGIVTLFGAFTNQDIRSVAVSKDENYLLISHPFYLAEYTQSETLNINYFSSGPNPNSAVYGAGNQKWIADHSQGLIKLKGQFDFEYILPTGPESSIAFDMDSRQGSLWVVGGGVNGTGWNSNFESPSVSFYKDGEWQRFGKKTLTAFDNNETSDFVSVAINTTDETNVFCGSMSNNGAVEFTDNTFSTFIDETNSSLQRRDNLTTSPYRITAACYDGNDHLWVANSNCSHKLSVKTKDGDWLALSLASFVPNGLITGIVADNNNNLWMLAPGQGVLVYNYNDTPIDASDDEMKMLTNGGGNGNLPSTDVYSITVDLDGEIWIGTAGGPAVVYSPSNVFNGGNFDAQQVYLEQDGNIQLLLETETITAIEVDPGNRKWIGTLNGGVFLMSEDGTTQLLNFNEDNSPLLSNEIQSIEVLESTGEVFFGTSKGLISFRGTATETSATYSNVLVYPNPVKPEYSGPIAIKGLAFNSSVKITDISGNLVYEGFSEGGQFIWHGTNFAGVRAQTGVYLVFATDAEGKNGAVAKIMFGN